MQDLVTTYSDLKIMSIRLEMAKQPGGNPEAWVSNALEQLDQNQNTYTRPVCKWENTVLCC